MTYEEKKVLKKRFVDLYKMELLLNGGNVWLAKDMAIEALQQNEAYEKAFIETAIDEIPLYEVED